MYKNWVKNVNKLYFNSRLVCVFMYTYFHKTIKKSILIVGKNKLIHIFIQFFLATHSTIKKSVFKLLKVVFSQYPHSLLSLKLINK